MTLPPSFREMEHIYQLRIQVEIVLAMEAMRVASDSDIAQLEEIASAMENSSPDEPIFSIRTESSTEFFMLFQECIIFRR